MAALFSFPFLAQLDRLETEVAKILTTQEKIMLSIADVKVAMNELVDRGDKLAVLTQTLHDHLVMLIEAGVPPTEAQLQELVTLAAENRDQWEADAARLPDPTP